MLQLLALAAGVIAAIMGCNSLFSGQIQLSKSKTITGPTAQLISTAVMLIGVAIIAFALIGLPLMLRR